MRVFVSFLLSCLRCPPASPRQLGAPARSRAAIIPPGSGSTPPPNISPPARTSPAIGAGSRRRRGARSMSAPSTIISSPTASAGSRRPGNCCAPRPTGSAAAPQPFEVPPTSEWANIVATLRLCRLVYRPGDRPGRAGVGLSQPRAQRLRRRRRRQHAPRDGRGRHRPAAARSRAMALMQGLCAIHVANADVTNAGLGFYKGLRFHIDARKYREWGTQGMHGGFGCVAVLAESGIVIRRPGLRSRQRRRQPRHLAARRSRLLRNRSAAVNPSRRNRRPSPCRRKSRPLPVRPPMPPRRRHPIRSPRNRSCVDQLTHHILGQARGEPWILRN